ncbi:MAG TPA: class I SAM-dependent methyltransferase [Prolixibacteraceae bacterium]|nr:class I SAM-dependent methyltransferase [Prolixibacteraceae bacterium]
MTQWYEALFTNYAKNYDQESFTQGTQTEVDFLEAETGYNKSATFLDLGCGTGRHSIELAKRGYTVTGIDLSENMLNRAKEKACEAGVKVSFIRADARDFHFSQSFDRVVMLCEGGFSLMETDEMNFSILKNAANVLKPGGKFIFTCLNALFPLFHSIDDFVTAGTFGVQKSNFDLMQFRDFSTYTIPDDDGKEMVLTCNERYYAPSEIRFMLHLLGFSKVEIFGPQIGLFDRNRLLHTEDYEMLIVAQKD